MTSRSERIPGKFALTKELWLVVLVKALCLIALWQFFFSRPASEHIKTDSAVASHVYGQAVD